jgi:hypothetical protein
VASVSRLIRLLEFSRSLKKQASVVFDFAQGGCRLRSRWQTAGSQTFVVRMDQLLDRVYTTDAP